MACSWRKISDNAEKKVSVGNVAGSVMAGVSRMRNASGILVTTKKGPFFLMTERTSNSSIT